MLPFLDLRIRTECSEHVNSFINAYWAYYVNVPKKKASLVNSLKIYMHVIRDITNFTEVSTGETDGLKPCHTTQFSLQVATQMPFHCKLQDFVVWQERLPRVTHQSLQLVSQRKIGFQVAEKEEAASTFRNATWEVAACETPTATCLAIFLRMNQSQYYIIRMPLTFLNTRGGKI